MKLITSFSCKTAALRTMQYQSRISLRRLVCRTICDSFVGDATIASQAAYLSGRIGASECVASQERCMAPFSTAPRISGCRAAGPPLVAATLLLFAHFAEPTFGAATVGRVPLTIEAIAQFLGFAMQPFAPIPEFRTVTF